MGEPLSKHDPAASLNIYMGGRVPAQMNRLAYGVQCSFDLTKHLKLRLMLLSS